MPSSALKSTSSVQSVRQTVYCTASRGRAVIQPASVKRGTCYLSFSLLDAHETNETILLRILYSVSYNRGVSLSSFDRSVTQNPSGIVMASAAICLNFSRKTFLFYFLKKYLVPFHWTKEDKNCLHEAIREIFCIYTRMYTVLNTS